MRLQAKEYLAQATHEKQKESTNRNGDFGTGEDWTDAVLQNVQNQAHVDDIVQSSTFGDFRNQNDSEQSGNPFHPGFEQPFEGEFMALLNEETFPDNDAPLDLSLELPFRSLKELDPQAKVVYIESLIATLIEADRSASLYDPEELVDVQARIDNYMVSL